MAKRRAHNKLTIEEVKRRLPSYITLDESTYSNTCAIARFIDKDYGEWWTRANDIFAGKKHRLRGYAERLYNKKLTAKEVQERLPEGLSLDFSTYVGTKVKAKFIHNEYGEWWAKPHAVITGKQNHPGIHWNNLDGKSVSALCKEKGVSPTSANLIYRRYGPQSCRDWIENYEQRRSSLEVRFSELIQGCGIEVLRHNKKIDFDGRFYRPDFVINDTLFIDVDGLYWHSDKWRNKYYHFQKQKDFSCKGLRLLQIREDEIDQMPLIVRSIVLAKSGILQDRVYARKLEMREVESDAAHQFLLNNHLMGTYRSAKHIGLYRDNSLVSLISYKKYKDGIDISRFCNKINTSVAGGLSRLLKEIERRESPKFIQSYVDLRYGNGESLTKLGFRHIKTTLGWKWTDGNSTFNRLRCRANMDKRRLSEREYAKERGWYRIYDAGQAKFVK